MPELNTYVIDTELQLRDAAAVTSSQASEVSAAAKVLDMGAGYFEGVALLDITTIDFTTGDERYRIWIQGSNDSGFASGNVILGGIQLGDAQEGGNDDSTIGRRAILFNNRVDTTLYQYIRLYEFMSGTSPILNFVSYLTKNPA
jgi:hypothetical protein